MLFGDDVITTPFVAMFGICVDDACNKRQINHISMYVSDHRMTHMDNIVPGISWHIFVKAGPSISMYSTIVHPNLHDGISVDDGYYT